MSRCPFIIIQGLDGSGRPTLRKSLFRLWQHLTGITTLSLLTPNYLNPDVAADLIEGKYNPSDSNAERYLRAIGVDKNETLNRLVRPVLHHRPVLSDRWLL